MLLTIAARHNALRSLRARAIGSLAAVRARARLCLTQRHAAADALGLGSTTLSRIARQSAAIRAGARTLVIDRRLAGALAAAAKKLPPIGQRTVQLAAQKMRLARIAAIVGATSLCGRFVRLSQDARAFARKSGAALLQRRMFSRCFTVPVDLTRSVRSVAIRCSMLGFRRHGASYSAVGRGIVSRTAVVLRTRLPLTRRHGPRFASGLCGELSAWTQRRRRAFAACARRILVEWRGSAFAINTKLRVQSAWRFARRVMVKARMEWIAGITAGVGVALCGMFFWMSWHARQIVIDDTYASASNLAVSVEQFIARTAETIDLSLGVATIEIAADGRRTPQDVHRLLANRLKHSPQMTGILVIDPDGRVRSSAGELPRLPLNVSKENYFRQALGSDKIRFTMERVQKPGSRGQRVIFASRRITRRDGGFAGVIAATISDDYIQRFLSTLHVGAGGSIALHTIDGTMLLRQPDIGDDVGKNFKSAPLFQDWLPWASSGVFPTNYGADGLRRIVGYQRIERLPLVAEVSLSQDEALAHWQRTTFWQAAVGGLILVLSGLTAFALHEQLRARREAHRKLSETVRELDSARRSAEQSSRVKSHFMANMSHELRTPLNAILGFSELIRDAHVGPLDARYQSYAQDIHGSGQHLLGLINDVLDLSKIEAGRLTLHEEPVDIAKLAGDCQRLLAERFRAAQVALAIELPPHAPRVRGDELRLKQIVLNLLSNAAKFTPAGGRVVLAVEAMPEGAICLSVADTGVGMRPEEIPLVLQPFRQVESSLNRRHDGAGLGLPLARTLAELHGGKLVIDSAPGEGTKVSITLPARRVVRDGETKATRPTQPDRHAAPRGTPRAETERETASRALQLG